MAGPTDRPTSRGTRLRATAVATGAILGASFAAGPAAAGAAGTLRSSLPERALLPDRPPAAVTAAAPVQDGSPSVQRGDQGELVAFWQDRWNDWAGLTGVEYGPLTVDGVFGPSTEEATAIFQHADDAVPTDLVVHPEDRVALRDAIRAAEDTSPPVQRGDQGELVAFWQDRWNDWAGITGVEYGPLTVDGVFGPSTEEATRIFQDASDAVPTDLVVHPEDRVALREAIEGAGPEVEPIGAFTSPPVETDGFPGTGPAAALTDIAIGDHTGFERVTFDFGDGALEYRIRYADEVAGASGEPVDVAGEHTLEVIVTPATGHDESGNLTYDGPDRLQVAATELVTEVVLVGDFENHLTFAVGLNDEVPVAHATLTDPVRLVLDLQES